jgi:NitT/TauT family transport system substrate-binding protein
MVRKDSGIARIEDLKGKVYGSIGIGSIGDIAVRVLLRRHGLSDKRDYSVVEAQSANLVPMLAAGKVDLITAQGIYYYDPYLRSIAQPLFAMKDAYGTTQASVFVSRAGFLAKNRPAVVDFLEDMLRAVHWYTDPANITRAAQIIARFTKLPPERFEPWIFTHDDLYRDPNGLPDLDALQRTFGIERDAGLLKEDIDAKAYADLSLIREAAARLK